MGLRQKIARVVIGLFGLKPGTGGGSSGGGGVSLNPQVVIGVSAGQPACFRQVGGAAGVNEVQVLNDGTNSWINTKQGDLRLDTNNNQFGFAIYDSVNTLFQMFWDKSTTNLRLRGGLSLGDTGAGTPPMTYTGTAAGVLFSNVNGGGMRIGSAAANYAFLTNITQGVMGCKTDWTSASAGWFQNTAGRARNTGDVTNATTTFASLSDTTINLQAGRKYTFTFPIYCKDSTAADGVKFDFNGGSATMTSFRATITQLAGAAATKGTDISTSLAGVLNYTAMGDGNDAAFLVTVSLVCNAVGTLIIRQAQNAHSTGTLTVQAGSFVWTEDMPN